MDGWVMGSQKGRNHLKTGNIEKICLFDNQGHQKSETPKLIGIADCPVRNMIVSQIGGNGGFSLRTATSVIMLIRNK